MTFVPGNRRILYLGTQTDAATAQTSPTKALRVTDFSPNETRQRITLAETDATTQQSSDVIVGYQPGGSFKVYLRPDTAALLFKSLLGANTDTGSTNFTHTITPAIATPYLTIYEVEPGSIWCRQFIGSRVTQIQLDGSTGGAIEATVAWESISVADGATAPSSPTPASSLPFVYPEIAVTRAGVHAGVVSQFTITISRNGNRAQGDNGFGSLDYVNGLFSIAGQFTKYVSDDTDIRQVDTGTTTGTVATAAIYEETLAIKATRDTNTSINFAMPAVSYPTRSAPVDTSGAPLAEVLGFRSDPQSTLAANLVVVAKDQLATPDS